MRKCFKIIILMFFSFNFSFADDILKPILESIGKEDDLSVKTKRESVGHLSVFTRQDLDRMRFRTLKDLFHYIRFMGYNENSFGLTDPLYGPYQPVTESNTRVYINERALIFPYQGSGIQFYGQIGLSHIDHVEIYWGVPSFSFGIGTSATIIKLYTKEPSRENTSVIGALVGTNSSLSGYGYTAYQYDDFSYLLSIEASHLKREKLYLHDGYPLSRDQDGVNIFTKFTIDNHNFTFNALKGKFDNFLGSSFSMKPTYNKSDLLNLYFGWDYVSDDGITASIGVSHANTKVAERADDIMGFMPNSLIPYSKYNTNIQEDLLDIHFAKEWQIGNNSFSLGYRGRNKQYNLSKLSYNDIDVFKDFPYNNELTSSLYFENNYLLDKSNLILFSGKLEHYLRNGGVKDEFAYSARLGYIHNEENWHSKTFIFYGRNPHAYYHLKNHRFFDYPQKKQETALAVTTELKYKFNNSSISAAIGQVRNDKQTLFNPLIMQTQKINNELVLNLATIEYKHDFDELNKFSVMYWLNKANWGDYQIKNRPDKITYQGGTIALSNNFNKFSLDNILSVYQDDNVNEYYLNYNLILTYKVNRKLEFFIKGENLFDNGNETKYIRINPILKTANMINAPLYERVVYFGMEYSF